MKFFKSSITILITILVFTGLNNACLKGTDPEQTEMELLAKYLAGNNITEDPKPSGLYYLETKEGSGLAPVIGDTVAINYIGKDLLQNVFDTNIEEKANEYGIYDMTRTYEPFRFKLGDSLIISGLSEGVSYMKEGGTATLILPSKIAFQNYQTIIYDVELLEVIKTSN